MKANLIAPFFSAGILLFASHAARAADVVTTPEAGTKITRVKGNNLLVESSSGSPVVNIQFTGSDRVERGWAGELIVMKGDGGRVHYRPDAYQMINNRFKVVHVEYKLDGKDRVAMTFGKFDASAPIFIRRGLTTFVE